jgi:enoyl-CoA hydratase/carnithine racemase
VIHVAQPALDHINLEHAGEHIVVATLNRPERLNALTMPMFDELHELQRWVEADPAIRVLILTGAGRGFCAGLDLAEAEKLFDLTTVQMWTGQRHWAGAVAGFRNLTKPVIAAVNGASAGAGFGLALAADIRIGSTAAKFNAAFVRIGLSAGDTGTSWMLPRLVGLGRAYEILLTGRIIPADEALAIGLLTDVVAPEALRDRAIAIAEQICGNSPFGIALSKPLIQLNIDAPSLEAAIALENASQTLCTRTSDMREALAAFNERRAPNFQNA